MSYDREKDPMLIASGVAGPYTPHGDGKQQEAREQEPLAMSIAGELMAQNMLDVSCVQASYVIERVLTAEGGVSAYARLATKLVRWGAQLSRLQRAAKAVCDEYWSKEGGIKTTDEKSAASLVALREQAEDGKCQVDDRKQQEARCESKLQQDGSMYRCDHRIGHDGPHGDGSWEWWDPIGSVLNVQPSHASGGPLKDLLIDLGHSDKLDLETLQAAFRRGQQAMAEKAAQAVFKYVSLDTAALGQEPDAAEPPQDKLTAPQIIAEMYKRFGNRLSAEAIDDFARWIVAAREPGASERGS